MNVKLTKGLAAAAISAAMMLGAAAPALATTYGEGDVSQVTLNKTYSANTENGAVAPSETFTLSNLTADSEAAKNFKLNGQVVLPTVEKTTAINGTSKDYFKIDLPDYNQVGEYTYTFNENAGKTAGVTYDSTEYVLKVTVTNELGEDNSTPTGRLIRKAVVKKESAASITDPKIESITNSYEANKLTVGKSVKGIFGDTTKDFTLTVTFEAPEGTDWKNAIQATPVDAQKASVTQTGDKTYTVTVKDGGKVTFTNVPDNAKYTVTEAAESKDGYDNTSGEVKDKVLADNGTETVINTKGGSVDTGVLLNNAPYIAIIGGAAVVAIYVVNKRRHSDMD